MQESSLSILIHGSGVLLLNSTNIEKTAKISRYFFKSYKNKKYTFHSFPDNFYLAPKFNFSTLMATQFKGVLFDMDGVIADTNAFHKKAIKVFCEQHDLEVTDAFLEEKVYGRINREWIPELFGQLSDAEIQQLADEKEALFREIYAPHLQPVAGLEDFLEHLQQENIKAIVATSAPGENADFILDGLHIRHYFQGALNSSHVTNGKPHPEMYQKAAAHLNLPTEVCLVFEDSLSGVQSGKNAGCSVVGITTTHTAQELQMADWIFDDFTNVTMANFQ